ncbi:MAG: response regulator [Parvularculaceae bacterium]|nr:response regulator [Parvularculaceae bacterium]
MGKQRHGHQRARRVFSRRYALAALMLVVLGCATAVVQSRMISAERARGEVIAMAAEQGALSQRAAFLVSGLDLSTGGCGDPGACSDLLATSQRMAWNHQILTGKLADSRFTPFIGPLRDLYAAGEPSFASKVERFVENGRWLSSDTLPVGADPEALINEVRIVGATSMFQTHRLMVEVLEAQAERSVRYAHFASTATLVGSLVLIALIFSQIFRPMISYLHQALAEAEASAAQAQRATRARGAFLKSASHELKTPLNAIMGLADMIKEGQGEEQELITEMQHASDHLLSMLNTMLDTHRLDEGRLELSPARHKLNQEMELTACIGRNLAQRKGLTFESRIDIDPALSVLMDNARLRQVCLNLLDNAARYTDEGQIGIVARIIEEGETDVLDLLIHDTGVGISDERLSVIFDRYTSAQSRNTSSVNGLGLGLALTRIIVELMGGSITIASTPGLGTSVTVRLPLTPVEMTAGSALPHSSTSERPRVLIVDDNQPNRMVADAMMTSLGCDTTLAEDGLEALKLARQQPFDLILMDIAMPVLDGIAATMKLRDDPGPNRGTPVVAVTAHVAPEDVQPMLGKGFDQVMHKPVRRHLLAQVVAQYGSTSVTASATSL